MQLLTVDGVSLGMARAEVVGHLGAPASEDSGVLRYPGRVAILAGGRLVQLQGGSVVRIGREEVARHGDLRGEVVGSLGRPDTEGEVDEREDIQCVFYEAGHQVLMVAYDSHRVCSFVLLPADAVPLQRRPWGSSLGG